MKIPSRFSSAFLKGFIIATVGLYWLVRVLSIATSQQQTVSNLDIELAKKIPREWIEASTTNWDQSKGNEVLWVTATFDETGVPIQAFRDKRLFSSLYPGYDLESFRSQILPTYFAKGFNQRAWIAPLSPVTPYGALTYRPSTACVPIFQNFGADILIFGDSSTMRAMDLSTLAHHLSPNSPLKILSCATGGILPETTTLIAKALKKPNGITKWTIVDLNRLPGYPESPDYQQEVKRQVKVLETEALPSISILGWLERNRASSLFPTLSWDALFSLNLQAFLTSRHAPADLATSPIRPDELVVAADAVSREAIENWAREQEARLSNHWAKSRPCPLKSFSGQLDTLIESLLEVSENVLLWMGPTTPLYHSKFGSCTRDEIVATLESKANIRVHTLTLDWKHYGLNYNDFLCERSLPPKTRIDIAHVNFQGALKVTDQISKWLIENGKPSSPII